MSGVELTAVWLFAIFCTAVTMTSVAKSVVSARIEVAKANAGAYVQAHRAVAEAQFGPTTVPTEWIPGGEL